MYSNFFRDFRKNESKDDLRTCWYVIGWYIIDFVCLSIPQLCYKLYIGDYGYNLTDFISMSLLTVLLLFLEFVLYNYKNFKKNRKPEYATFKFDDFKKWYTLTPEKFVFESNGLYLYYIHTDEVVYTKDFQGRYSFNDWDTTLMYPETFVDSVRYEYFINKIYDNLMKNKEKVDTCRANVQANNEKVRVMNSLQKDIEKILKDSQNVINQEAEKLEAKKYEL